MTSHEVSRIRRIGELATTQTLHFIVNEGLMTIFFLVAGLEIRREIHEGALSSIRSAALPIVAAIGGVIVLIISKPLLKLMQEK